MGIRGVWALADRVGREAGRRIRVIGPPPRLTRWVNHKGAFCALVRRLLGATWVPELERAGTLVELAEKVARLASQSRLVGVKLPDSAGGEGNVVLESRLLRELRGDQLRDLLRGRLEGLRWDWRDVVLVGPWLEEVVGTPSVQTWVVPVAEGEPVVEGVFDQVVVGERGQFVGSAPSRLEEDQRREIATRAWALAKVFQRLGYVGRCSFDLITTRDQTGALRPQFIECNGRWGGTSGPMLLVKRVVGESAWGRYATYECEVPGLVELEFGELLARLGGVAHDRRTGRGWLIVYNPGHLACQGGMRYVALGATREEAAWRAMQEVPRLLREVAGE
jgi:hypothetical protein